MPGPSPTQRPLVTPIARAEGTTEVRLDEACLQGGAGAEGRRLEATARLNEFGEPFVPLPFVLDGELKTRLDGIVGERAGVYAYYVKDMQTGLGAAHNAEQIFEAASTFKLWVMHEVFRQVELGLIDWDDELVVTPYYDAFALSPRSTQLCQVLTVAQATDAMLSVSDNAAAVLLQDVVGAWNINAGIGAMGVRDSGLFAEGLPVTAADLGLLMEAIAVGEAVNASASAEMVGLLSNDVFDNGLVDGVPTGVLVARKTGNLGNATNVAGLVFAPSGPYVFVALTSNGYERDVIRALSGAAYAHFEGGAP